MKVFPLDDVIPREIQKRIFTPPYLATPYAKAIADTHRAARRFLPIPPAVPGLDLAYRKDRQ
jgi:hypothetical protein